MPPALETWLTRDLALDARAEPEAIRLKLDKLARDAFAFFRGTLPAYVRAVRPQLKGPLAEAEGLVTGDLHLENFGTFHAEGEEVTFDLNDFDEATRAPLLVDLRRLCASAGLAGIAGGCSPARSAEACTAVLDGFCAGCEGGTNPLDPPASVLALLRDSARQRRAKFVRERTVVHEGRRRRLRTGETLHAVDAGLAQAIQRAARDLRARTPAPRRHPLAYYAVLDAGRRLAGNGSLGRRRYLVLLAGPDPARGHHALLDFKEPRPSAWGPTATLLGERQRALQVERSARALRPASESLLGTARLQGRLFQVRELSPHGMKLAAAQLPVEELIRYARFAGMLLARRWRRARQPAEALARRLDAGGRVRLLEQALADVAQSAEDHARFLARREAIEHRLGLGARAA